MHSFEVAPLAFDLCKFGKGEEPGGTLKDHRQGESATKAVIDGIRKIVDTQPEVERVNEILTMHMGPDFILLNLSVEFRDEETAPDLEQVIARMDREIKTAFPEVKRVFIEAETSERGRNQG